MNWYKHTQQSLLFYPWEKQPESNTQKYPPSYINEKSGEIFYKCVKCNKDVSEHDVQWYRDIKNQGEILQLPGYNQQAITYGLIAIGRYLQPHYVQVKNYIRDKGLEGKRNNQYDYGFTSGLNRWEIQVPDLPNLISKYPALSEICRFKNSGWFSNSLCKLIISPSTKINGSQLLELENLINNPERIAQEMSEREFSNYSNKEFNIDYMVPICETCMEEFKTCDFCRKIITPDIKKYQSTYDDEIYICDECVENGRAEVCQDCGKADSTDDIRYLHDGIATCSECYRGKGNQYIEQVKDIISNLDIPIGKNLPISSKVLNNLDQFLNRYLGKYGNVSLDSNEMSKLHYVAKKSNLTKGALDYLGRLDYTEHPKLEDVMNSLQRNIAAQDYMKEHAPNVSNYVDVPYDVQVVNNYNYGTRGQPGFTIAIVPSDEFFDYAKKMFGEKEVEKVWSRMNRSPHHTGVMAYARCSFDEKNIVINNLQRDVDYDAWDVDKYSRTKKNQEIARWIDNSTKHWDTYLLTMLKSIGIAEKINVYLTTFNQQKQKWGNLPIYKSKRTYEEVPSRMGFPLEEDHGMEELVEEDTSGRNDPMYRVAQSWFKKAKYELV